MAGPSNWGKAGVPRPRRYKRFWPWFAVLFLVSFAALPGFAERVPVADGTAVNLKLVNIVTTDNVQKGDVIAFEVSRDVVVNGRVVIARGAAAHGRIVEVKGAYKPRDVNAEVVFQFLTVRAADQQDLPLRKAGPRGAKGKELEVHEKSAIPGQIMRVVGADKGKEYEAYINGSFTIGAPEVMAVEAPAPPPVAPTAPPPVAPAPAPPTAPPAVPPSAPVLVAPSFTAPSPTVPDSEETSSVEFESTPDGADIVIDGRVLGTTRTILHLAPGRHEVEIRLEGYLIWARRMVVDPDSHQSLRVTLTPR